MLDGSVGELRERLGFTRPVRRASPPDIRVFAAWCAAAAVAWLAALAGVAGAVVLAARLIAR